MSYFTPGLTSEVLTQIKAIGVAAVSCGCQQSNGRITSRVEQHSFSPHRLQISSGRPIEVDETSLQP